MHNIIGADHLPRPAEPGWAAPDQPAFTLRGLIDAAGSAVRRGLPRRLWVEAQVLAASKREWGWLVQLVDAQDEQTANSPRLTCTASQRRITAIGEELDIAFDPEVLVGTCALIEVEPTFHARHQFGLKLLSVNPAYGVGLVQLQVERLRQTLKGEGQFERQHRLQRPPDVTGIAVITPERSAGLADVEQEMQHWSAAGILQVKWLTAQFEGPRAATSLADAFARASHLALAGQVDVVLVVRGGGAKAGVAAASSERAIRGLLSIPVPVITGIGHASDVTLMDEVAWHHADTPSKALSVIRRLFTQPAEAALRDWREITSSALHVLRYRLGPDLECERDQLIAAAQQLVSAEIAGIEGLRTRLEFCRAGSVVQVRQLRTQLDEVAETMRWFAAVQPGAERDRVDELYTALLIDGRGRLQSLDDLEAGAQDSESLVVNLVSRQRLELEAMLHQTEQGAQHVLALAAADLERTYGLVRAVDIDALLERGLAIAVRDDGTLLKSASAASSEPGFKLIFADGVVAVVPGSSHSATVLH